MTTPGSEELNKDGVFGANQLVKIAFGNLNDGILICVLSENTRRARKERKEREKFCGVHLSLAMWWLTTSLNCAGVGHLRFYISGILHFSFFGTSVFKLSFLHQLKMKF